MKRCDRGDKEMKGGEKKSGRGSKLCGRRRKEIKGGENKRGRRRESVVEG